MSQVKKATPASCYLSEELLMEIIKSLPVKYILRCKCVQKSWYHFLRSPYFEAMHSRHQKRYLLFANRVENYFSLRFDDEKCEEYCQIPVPQDIARIRALVYETCNGLICLSGFSTQKVWLWNPALRVFDVLPPTGDSFAGTTTTTGLAFGYSAKTNDYKIIKYEDKGGHEVCVYVYSLGTDSWKVVKKGEFGDFSCCKSSNSVVVNGFAYWVVSLYEYYEDEKEIVCFDMENDTIRHIMLPPPFSENNADSDVLLGNSKFGELLSLYYYDRQTYNLHIWVLENAGEPNEAWTKKKSLNFEITCRYRPMSFRINGEIVLRSCGKFLTYDLEKNEARDIVDDESKLQVFCQFGEICPSPYQVHQGINQFEETMVLFRQAETHRVSQRSGTSMKHDKSVEDVVTA